MSVDQLPPGKARRRQARRAVRPLRRVHRQADSDHPADGKDGRRDDRTLGHGDRHARLPARRGDRRTLARAGRIQPGACGCCCSSRSVAACCSTRRAASGRSSSGSINPAYAAHAIEQDNPSLKNSLLNLLLFRAAPRRCHRRRVRNARRAGSQAAHPRAGRLGRRSHAAACDWVTCSWPSSRRSRSTRFSRRRIRSSSAERVLMPWAQNRTGQPRLDRKRRAGRRHARPRRSAHRVRRRPRHRRR